MRHFSFLFPVVVTCATLSFLSGCDLNTGPPYPATEDSDSYGDIHDDPDWDQWDDRSQFDPANIPG